MSPASFAVHIPSEAPSLQGRMGLSCGIAGHRPTAKDQLIAEALAASKRICGHILPAISTACGLSATNLHLMRIIFCRQIQAPPPSTNWKMDRPQA